MLLTIMSMMIPMVFNKTQKKTRMNYIKALTTMRMSCFQTLDQSTIKTRMTTSDKRRKSVMMRMVTMRMRMRMRT
jgi:hypothetical protein